MRKTIIKCDICGKEADPFFSTFEYTLVSSRSPIKIAIGLDRVFVGSKIGKVGHGQPDLCELCTIEALKGLLLVASSRK